MADRPDDGDLDVRLEWPGGTVEPRRPPSDAPAPDVPRPRVDRPVRLKVGDGRSVAALRDELEALRAEVSGLRDELSALQARVDGAGA